MAEKKSNKGVQCRNCGQALIAEENYCPSCGQKNDIRRLSVKEYVVESLGNFFSYDSKIIRSLIPFFTKPGILSRKYIDGERAKYVIPFRMYMFFSVLFFLVAGFYQDTSTMDDMLRMELPETLISDNDTALYVDSNNIQVDSSMAIKADTSNMLNKSFDFNEAYQYARRNPDTSVVRALYHLRFEQNRSNMLYYELSTKFIRMDRVEFARGLFEKLPVLVFLFIPLLAMFLKLFYIRSDIYYSEHLTYLLQTNSMIFFLATLGLLLRKTFDVNIYFPAFLFYSIYFLLAMKNFYKQGWFMTIIKYILIGFCYLLMLPAFFIISVFVLYLFN